METGRKSTGGSGMITSSVHFGRHSLQVVQYQFKYPRLFNLDVMRRDGFVWLKEAVSRDRDH